MFFYSINISVVVEEKSWEEALEHCRGINSDLSSLHSDTDNMAAPITDRAWIGLRFLGDRWLWVNGDPLEYQAWSDGGDQQCPMQNRCGALNKGGLWENRDCEERLNFICSSYV
ncbi:dromaiocalcin-1-like [Pungitius pungitius]|uniref:dromaiocalcin-1-like n=1 Tax=Pungitius pungitius TaxID=134920 RepID=UPI0018893CF0|nr:dromaiocalcin-1-like [Pungitius pungitius]